MAIPVARVHLAMAHAALPGLLPTPPNCTMLPLLPAPPCAILLPNNSPPRPSRADAAGRWDAHKTKPPGSTASSSSSSLSSGGHHSLDSNKKMVTSSSRTSSDKNSRADSEERWDAHKRPASPASLSFSPTASSNKAKTCHIISRRPNGQRSSASAERWDAHKKPRAPPPADGIDDGESSTGSNDLAELDMPRPLPPPRSFYAGPGFFIKSPEPSMLPMPSFCRIRVA